MRSMTLLVSCISSSSSKVHEGIRSETGAGRLPQHFLYFLPLWHGQGSLRPILAMAFAGVYPKSWSRPKKLNKAIRVLKSCGQSEQVVRRVVLAAMHGHGGTAGGRCFRWARMQRQDRSCGVDGGWGWVSAPNAGTDSRATQTSNTRIDSTSWTWWRKWWLGSRLAARHSVRR